MMNSKSIFGVLLLMSSVVCGKWKIGTITNKTKDLKLESAWYGKQKKTSITHLTQLLPQAAPVPHPLLAKSISFNSMVSQRSNGCCLILATRGDVKHKISFDAHSSLAIHQGRKKTQFNTGQKCIGIDSCDLKKSDYCARVFIEVLSKDNQWENTYCGVKGYNLLPGQSYVTFNVVLSGSNGNYQIELQESA